jgi:hypothetical protein
MGEGAVAKRLTATSISSSERPVVKLDSQY